jgi:hypothetical protein
VSDHCRSCIPEFDDLVGITTEDDWDHGLAAVVMCEGCGAVQVDPEGYCLGDCTPYFHPDQSHQCRHCIEAQKSGEATCLFHRSEATDANTP